MKKSIGWRGLAVWSGAGPNRVARQGGQREQAALGGTDTRLDDALWWRSGLRLQFPYPVSRPIRMIGM